MHNINIINLRTQRVTYFIPSVDVFCYCHFLKDIKFVLTVKSCVLCDCLFSTLCVATIVYCRLVLWSVDRPIILILFANSAWKLYVGCFCC